ncbi:MAG: class I SAM-dependent methyltransferase [bacterium]|nr:class I SAM-dependent methyltransferase [bacterium]
MKKNIEYYKRNMEIASDLISKQYKIRDNFLLGQPFYLDLLNYIVDIFKVVLPPKSHILEVSCGTGILAEMLLKELDDISIDVTDISKETLKVVREKTERFGDRIRFLKKDNSDCSFSGKYDAIYTTDAMRLSFVDYSKLYLNFYNVLKKNGVILIGEDALPIRRTSKLLMVGDMINDTKTKDNSTKPWREFTSRKEWVEKVNGKDILKVVKYYSAECHIAKLKKAGFNEAKMIYQKYNQLIIAGLKGKLSFREI